MQKTLLTTTLAIIGSFVVGSSALAAPSIAYKKQLSVPTIPSATLSKIAAMDWQYPTTASSTNGLGTFKNVVLAKPEIRAEKECGGVMYRMWAVSMDRDATKKTQQNIEVTQAPFYSVRFGTRYVFEARTPSLVKWSIDPMYKGIYDLDHPAPSDLFSCAGKNIIISYGIQHPRNGFNVVAFRTIRYASFTTTTEWSNATSVLTLKNSIPEDNKQLRSVDGIMQYPGFLLVKDSKITGDSRPITGSSNGLLYHTVPHYRDLTVTNSSTTIKASFYRLSDGYGVEEVSYTNGPATTLYYRIKNGEAGYSKVDSLPFNEFTQLTQDASGLRLKKAPNTNIALVHGLPATGYTTTGDIVWETEAQVYTRYTITNTATGKQQYWEATVNKK